MSHPQTISVEELKPGAFGSPCPVGSDGFRLKMPGATVTFCAPTASVVPGPQPPQPPRPAPGPTSLVKTVSPPPVKSQLQVFGVNLPFSKPAGCAACQSQASLIVGCPLCASRGTFFI